MPSTSMRSRTGIGPGPVASAFTGRAFNAGTCRCRRVLTGAAAQLTVAKVRPLASPERRNLCEVPLLTLLVWVRRAPGGEVFGRAEQVHQSAVGWTSRTRTLHSGRLPDPRIRVARVRELAWPEFQCHTRPAFVARGLATAFSASPAGMPIASMAHQVQNWRPRSVTRCCRAGTSESPCAATTYP